MVHTSGCGGIDQREEEEAEEEGKEGGREEEEDDEEEEEAEEEGGRSKTRRRSGMGRKDALGKILQPPTDVGEQTQFGLKYK